MLCPDPRDPHVADPEVGRQFAGTPVCHPVSWCSPRSLQNAGFFLRSIVLRSLPAMPAIQPRHSFIGKLLAPRRNKSATTPHSVTHGSPRRPLSQEQNDPGPPRSLGPPPPASRLSVQFHPFTCGQDNRVGDEHEYSLQMGVTIH